MLPLISVVLCTYNGELFVKEQIESIVGQSYQPLEIIICDDASTDKTGEILALYEGHTNIHIIYNRLNIGLSKNIEQALGYCKGEYIAFSDQDDLWMEDKVSVLFNAIGEDILIYSDSELVDDKGTRMNIKLSGLRNMHSGNNNAGFAFSNCVWGHTMMIHSSLLKYLLPFPDKVPHDSWAGFVAASVKRIHYLDKSLNFYRQHQNTVTTTLPLKRNYSGRNEKQENYIRTFNWLNALSSFKSKPNNAFFEELSALFKTKQNKKFSWPLFWFLLKHRSLLFDFSKKSPISKINEIRKLSRGIVIDDSHFTA